ncbi:caspase family protein [Thermogemmatispora carboxidivorans]|uniref:caspase family protein n=1 Tax=Thermogemmatispora carboxidivorans TaxID=1382306 RepID=UPI00069BDCEE|nr:caspase family protein [Thermogemmatispora carboxidivorans]
MSTPSSPAFAMAGSGQRLALVIGVNGPPAAYRAPLAYAEADACGMAEVLAQDCCGFTLVVPPVLGAQATSAQVRKAVVQLARELQAGDFGLVFFSGHAEALPREADLDEVYLVTADFDPADLMVDPQAHLSFRWLRQVLFEHERAAQLLLILDCCYGGKFAESAPDPSWDELQRRLSYYFGEPGERSPAPAGGVRLALTATGLEAAREQDGHGLLTGQLLKLLRGEVPEAADAQGRVTFARAFASLAQTLREQPPRFYGAGDDLVLARHPQLAQARRRSRAEDEERQRLLSLMQRRDGFYEDRRRSCVGRRTEQEAVWRLVEELLPTGGYVTITGEAGQGKSCLMARLIEERARAQGGEERVAFHFIPLVPPSDYQVTLLKALLARLVLKYELPAWWLAGESRTTLSEALVTVLQEIARRGEQEVIFIDGLDQLQPDPQSGWRDLSFLPQGPANPPPGIVFVLGTRPNDTLRPLELCKPRREYRLPRLSLADFAELLQQRQVDLSADLEEQSYEVLDGHALFLDLLARELATRRGQAPAEVEALIARLSSDPEQLFTLALDRLRGEPARWHRVIKPLLGILLVAQEPLPIAALRQLLALARGETIDLDEVRQGLRRLGGLVMQDQQGGYTLFHLKFRDYLRGGPGEADGPQKEPEGLFDEEEERRWHGVLAAWCEQGRLARLWQDGAREKRERYRRQYGQRHYVRHLYEAGEWERLFAVLDEGSYGRAKVQADPSMRDYARDLDLGRRAAAEAGETLEEQLEQLPRLWGYTLLRCSLGSRADAYPDAAFVLLCQLGQEAKALGLVELLTEQERRADLLIDLSEWLLRQPERRDERRQLYRRAEQAIALLADGWDKANLFIRLGEVLAKAELPQEAERCWQEAERVIASLSEDAEKATMLVRLGKALAATRPQQAEQCWLQAERLSSSHSNTREKVWTLISLGEALAKWSLRQQQAERCWQEAERLIASFADQDWNRVDALIKLGEALAGAQCWEQAEQCWQQAEQLITAIPDEKDSWRKVQPLSSLAEAFIGTQRWLEAERVIASLPEHDWRKAMALIALGKALAKAQRWQDAEQCWVQAQRLVTILSDGSDRVEVLAELAKALAETERWQEAKQCWAQAERLIAVSPIDKAEALTELSNALISVQRWEEAEQCWQQAERAVASYTLDNWSKAEVYVQLARTLMRAQRWQDAEQCWAQAELLISSLDDEKIAARSRLSEALAHAQRWLEAERVIASLPEHDWRKAEALIALGKALAKAQRQQEALKCWQQAEQLITAIPDEEDSWRKVQPLSSLAEAFIGTQRWLEAERVIASLPEHDWRKAMALIALGKALAKAQRWQDAEQCWVQAQRLVTLLAEDSDKVKVLTELATACATIQRWKEAEQCWLQSEQLIAVMSDQGDSPRKMQALSQLAASLATAERWQDAQRIIASLPEDSSEKAVALTALIEALANARQGQETEQCLQEVARMLIVLPARWEEAKSLTRLTRVLISYGHEAEAIRLIQHAWLRDMRLNEAVWYLPAAFPLLTRYPKLGSALYDAICWADAFLQGGASGPVSLSLLRARSSESV